MQVFFLTFKKLEWKILISFQHLRCQFIFFVHWPICFNTTLEYILNNTEHFKTKVCVPIWTVDSVKKTVRKLLRGPAWLRCYHFLHRANTAGQFYSEGITNTGNLFLTQEVTTLIYSSKPLFLFVNVNKGELAASSFNTELNNVIILNSPIVANRVKIWDVLFWANGVQKAKVCLISYINDVRLADKARPRLEIISTKAERLL